MDLQYITNQQGEAVFVVLPIETYRRLIDEDDNQWTDIAVESNEFDDTAIPNDVVGIMADKDVSQIAAWRIYRGLTQAQAAQQADISQAALSQIERKDSQPQAQTREIFAKIYNCLPEQLAG